MLMMLKFIDYNRPDASYTVLAIVGNWLQMRLNTGDYTKKPTLCNIEYNPGTG